MEQEEGMWIFGYGSLTWKPSFSFHKSEVGYIKNYKRRFWQGSTDHRGVPGSPGRVVTLVPTKKEKATWGIAYFITQDKVNEVLDYLDFREKGGYTREFVAVYTKDNHTEPFIRSALLYRATEDNPEFLGPAPRSSIAKQIVESVGPSGKNVEYFFNLLKAMRDLEIHDKHLTQLEEHILEVMSGTSKLQIEGKK